MRRRVLSAVIAVIMIISVTGIFSHAATPDNFDDEVIAYGQAASAVVREMGTEFAFDSPVTKSELDTVVVMVFNDNPLMFALSNKYSYAYKTNPFTGEMMVTKVKFSYTMDRETYEARLTEVNEWADKVVRLAGEGLTELEYAMFFHDYLCANYEYDTALDVRDIYTFIKTGHGVCQAYTEAYKILLERVGVEVSWASSAEMVHVWNMVKIDGEWYHADLTWDDPTGAAPGMARHKNFLLSDKGISTSDRGHYGWISYHTAASEKYDAAPWRDVTATYAKVGDEWYYLKDKMLYGTPSPDEVGREVKKLDLVWGVWDSEAVYTAQYVTLLSYGKKLYYSTPTSIMRYDPEKKTEFSIYDYEGTDGYIYGFVIDMGEDGVSGADMPKALVKAHVSTASNKAGRYVGTNLAMVVPEGCGDVTGDGRVNLSDVSAVLKYIAKWEITLDEVRVDFDENGRVNLADVNRMMKYIAGWAR